MITLLTSKNIRTTQEFYACLGLAFVREKHGDGPEHFSISFKNAVFEIYPELPNIKNPVVFRIEVNKLEDCLNNIELLGGKLLEPINSGSKVKKVLVADPDGRVLRLIEKQG